MFLKFHKLFESLTTSERQIFEGALLLFLISFILNGINVFYKDTAIRPIEGGIYREGVIGQPISINPILAGNNEADKDLIEFLFKDLYTLSESQKISNEGKTWLIRLKNKIFWSDGSPITGDDVVFTVKTIQNPEARSSSFQTWEGINVEKINELEVRFDLKTPYIYFSDNLKNLKLIPKHIFDKIPPSNIRLSDFNLEPVSSGPYVFDSYSKRKDGFIKEYRFKPNNYYFESKSLIDDFRFVFFADTDEAIDAFNKRAIDGLGGISAGELDQIKINHDLWEIKIPRYYSVFFNSQNAATFQEKNVRLAINYAINRKEIIDSVFNGRAEEATGPILVGMEGYKIYQNDFDLEKAKKLLEDASWKIGDDGVRQKTSGKDVLRLEFDLVAPESEFLKQTAELIKKQLAGIGMKININILPPKEISSGIIKQRSYQMLLFGNVMKNNPDVISFWHSLERFYPGLNLSLYDNKNLDDLLESVRKNFNKNSRIKDIKKIQDIIRDDVPSIFLYSPNYLYIVPKNLGGFKIKSILNYSSKRFEDVNEWFLKTARVFK